MPLGEKYKHPIENQVANLFTTEFYILWIIQSYSRSKKVDFWNDEPFWSTSKDFTAPYPLQAAPENGSKLNEIVQSSSKLCMLD